VADGPDDGLTGLGRRSALALVGAGVSGVATIATLIIANRTLTGPAAGEFFVAISLFAIVQGLCSLGAETGLQYFVPTMTGRSARRLIWIVSAASAVAGVLIAATVWALAEPFGDLLGSSESSSGDTFHVVRTIAVLLPFAGLYEVMMGALRSRDQVLISTVLDGILRPMAQVIGMLAAAALSAGSQGAVLAWGIPNAATVICAWFLLVKTRRRENSGHTDDVSQGEFWRYTAPRSVARIAQTLTQRLDVLILAAVYPLEDAAVYGTVSRCMIAGVFMASALRQTVQPKLRRLIVKGDRAAVKNMYGASTTWLLLLTWPVYLAMITHAPLVMSVFGSDYVRGAPALVLLCLAMLVATACGLVDVVLLMLGRSWLSTANVLVALGLNVVLNLALAPSYGMIGSAIAWVVAILATNLLPLSQTARVGLHPGGPALTTAMVLSVATIAAPLALERVVFGTALAPFLIASAIALVLYGSSLRRFRDRLLLDRLVNDLRRPLRSVTDG
jgi:O-antigen/teichoic acid export membrane protein